MFKDVQTRSQLTKKDFYNYQQKSDKQRVMESLKVNNDNILKKNMYEYIDKSKNWLRKRQNNHEIQKPMKFGGNVTDKERMEWHFKKMPPTDTITVPTKQKFYIDPKWKVTQPKKWVGRQDFKTGRSIGWKLTTNSKSDLYEPHIDGFEVTGDTQTKRKVQKEVSSVPFVSTIQPCKSIKMNENGFMTTKSIRNYKSCHSLLASISPQKYGPKTNRGDKFNHMNYDFDYNIPIEIKIRNGISASSEKPMSVTSKSKMRSKMSHFQSIEELVPEKPQKLYYKSIQSKMINPKSKTKKLHIRRVSMDDVIMNIDI